MHTHNYTYNKYINYKIVHNIHTYITRYMYIIMYIFMINKIKICSPPQTTAPLLPFYFPSSSISFFLKEREEENIQKRDWPSSGPSLRNSWPKLLPHFAQETLNADGPSERFDKQSGVTVSVNAGHGDECLYFFVLWKSSVPHCEQVYTPLSKWFWYTSPEL